MNAKRLFLYLLIGSVAVSAVIGIAVVLIGNFGDLEVRVLLTTLTIAVTSILGLACGAAFETGRGRELAGAGIILSAVSGVLWIVLLWAEPGTGNVFPRALMSTTLIAAACAHLSLLGLARLSGRFVGARYAGHFAVWGLAGVLLWFIWFGTGEPGPVLSRAMGVLAILAGTVTVVTPVFHRLSASAPDRDAAIDAEIDKLRTRLAELEAEKAARIAEN